MNCHIENIEKGIKKYDFKPSLRFRQIFSIQGVKQFELPSPMI